jgi:hypothetical protein
MRFIPTQIHGVLDYLYSALLLAAPWIFGFADGGTLQWLSMLAGAGTLIMSLLTDYEFSLRRWIYLPSHLAIDVVAGLGLAGAAYLVGDVHGHWPILAGAGLFSALAGGFTLAAPSYAPPEVLRV